MKLSSLDPVSAETRRLLTERWKGLPQHLRQDNQTVGKHWVQCGYTLGPSYCSFGCSHCYLPGNANRVPLVPLQDMKAQIDANRAMLGQGGSIQITGGDVVDAYWRTGKSSELTEILAYANASGLVPMLMTHGQTLLQNPDYLEELVVEGGLRKLSLHIDITQAGRNDYPIKSLKSESQLNPLRDEFVRLVLDCRKKTGHQLRAAQTVTVTEANIDSISDIIAWLTSKPENMEVCRTISFQTEARTGRTRCGLQKITPDQTWQSICDKLDMTLPRDHLLFGHPDCSSTATLIVRSSDRKIVRLSGEAPPARKFWSALLTHYGGVGARGQSGANAWARKLIVLAMHPSMMVHFFAFVAHLFKHEKLPLGMLWSCLTGRAKGFNIVMHNFMDDDQLSGIQSPRVKERLNACSFRGAVKQDGKWKAVPMCQMNASLRQDLYQTKIDRHRHQSTDRVAQNRVSTKHASIRVAEPVN